jgi:hypothetical protein
VIKWRRLNYVGYRVLVGKPEGRRPLDLGVDGWVILK